MTAKEFLQRLPEALNTRAASRTEATIQFELPEPVHQVLKGGSLTVFEGAAESPDLTIIISDENLVQLFRGELNPMTAFATGKVKLKGDMMLAQKFIGLFDQKIIASFES
jgi:putative sterol carrier protein